MATSFMSLPRELRDEIYKLALLEYNPIRVHSNEVTDLFSSQTFEPRILLASKTIYSEANPVLYSENTLDFTAYQYFDVAQFFDQIGRQNASLIRHIRVDFPDLHNNFTGIRSLDEDSVLILACLASHCRRLKTITMSADKVTALDKMDDPDTVRKALALVNAYLRMGQTVEEIIAEVYEADLDSSQEIKKQMSQLGWMVREIEPVGEEEDLDDNYRWEDEQDYSDDCADYSDEYDIDNDSDFWRRAAD